MSTDPFPEHTVLIPGPTFHVDLAPLDARHPVHYSCRLLIFPCASSTQRASQLAAFKIGLQTLVSRCPILSGIVVPLPAEEIHPGLEDWRTIVPSQGLELIVEDFRETLSSFRDIEASEFLEELFPFDQLAPIPAGLTNENPFAACKVQFSAVEGGTIIAFALSHSVADGSGMNEIMRVLSEGTRFAQDRSGTEKEENHHPMGLDRSLLRNLSSIKPFNLEDHPAFTWETGPPPNQPPHPFQATKPETAVWIKISPTGLAKLKADATDPDGPPISTHDALTALLWRSIFYLRHHRNKAALDVHPSTVVHLLMPSDARRHLGLAASYVGNAVYQLCASVELGELLSENGLRVAARAVREAIKSVTKEIVESYMVQLKEKWVGWQFMVIAGSTAVAMGTDWTSGGLYDQEWGEAFGRARRCRYPGIPGAVGHYIAPRLPDGSAEVCVAVGKGEVEWLRGVEGFGKYMEI